MSRLQKLREAVFGIPEVVTTKVGKIILGKVKQTYGVRLPTNFRTQVNVYNSDPCLKESIIQMAEQIVCGGGFFVTVNEKYKTSLPKPEGEDNWNSREAINYFNETNNLDGKLLLIAIELIAFGNSLWYIKEGLKHIPIESIEQALPKKKTVPIETEYNLKTTYNYGAKTVNWGEFLHFRTNVTGYEPFGTGIILGLIASPDNDTPSLWDIRKSVRKSMKEGFEKFSFGNELWVFDGMPDDKIEELGKKITSMKSTGQRIATNVKGDIRLAVPQRTQSYDKWIETIRDEFYMALANPSLKLGLEQGFTKATSETAKELYEMKIQSLRRVIKRVVEGLWKNILTQYGFDSIKAGARLHFGSDEIEYELVDVFKAVELNIISKEEARTLLREYSKWKLEKEVKENEEG